MGWIKGGGYMYRIPGKLMGWMKGGGNLYFIPGKLMGWNYRLKIECWFAAHHTITSHLTET